jgi:hypothetical protein
MRSPNAFGGASERSYLMAVFECLSDQLTSGATGGAENQYSQNQRVPNP